MKIELSDCTIEMNVTNGITMGMRITHIPSGIQKHLQFKRLPLSRRSMKKFLLKEIEKELSLLPETPTKTASTLTSTFPGFFIVSR